VLGAVGRAFAAHRERFGEVSSQDVGVACAATPAGVQADDTFLVDGNPDADELWGYLSDATAAFTGH
jgi:hypothetical protein